MMNQQDLLKKTGNILRELQEQYELLMQSPQNLSELELELFHANANFLTEHIQILKKVAGRVVVPELPEHTAVNPKESTPAVNVYQDLFKPDVETPTFEFIVHDQLKQPAVQPQEDAPASRPAPLPPQEEESIIAAQDETIVQESNPISQPVMPILPLAGSVDREVSDQQQDPSAQQDKEPVQYIPIESTPEEEEDEIGPEPFLVTREPEFTSTTHLTPEPAAEQAPEPVESTPPVTPQKEAETKGWETREPVIQRPTAMEPPTAVTKPEANPRPEPVKHQPTLNEMLASKSSVVNINLSESGKPVITDLKSAINLNEKLLFIKDLFDGYNLAYSEAIDLVNKMPDFASADKFLQSNYAGKHQWSSKPATVEQLYDLLHQRFPK